MSNSSNRDILLAEQREKQRRALEARKTGASYEAIARVVGLNDKSAARKLVMAALAEIIEEPAQEVRALELSRLDQMLLGLWKAATSGNQGAIDRVLKIMERRAALLGLDPVQTPQVQVNVNGLAQFLGAAFRPRQLPPEGATATPPEVLALPEPPPDPAFLDVDDKEEPTAIPIVDPDDLQ